MKSSQVVLIEIRGSRAELQWGVEFLHVNGLNKEKSLKVFVSKTEKQTIFNERICGEKIITIYYHKAYFYQTCGYCCSGERLGPWTFCLYFKPFFTFMQQAKHTNLFIIIDNINYKSNEFEFIL